MAKEASSLQTPSRELLHKMTRQNTENDLRASDNVKRIDDLEVFRKEFDGKGFDSKVLQSIRESHLIREELAIIIWQTLKNKIIWIIIGALGVIFIDVMVRVIPHLFSLLSGK